MQDLLAAADLPTVQVSHSEMKKAAFYKTILTRLSTRCAPHGLTMGQAMRLRHTRGKARVLCRRGDGGGDRRLQLR